MNSCSGASGLGRLTRQLNINVMFSGPPALNMNETPPLSPVAVTPPVNVGSPLPGVPEAPHIARISRSSNSTSGHSSGHSSSEHDDPELVGPMEQAPQQRNVGREYRRVFKANWRTGRPWLMHLRPTDGPRSGLMKCASCIHMHSRSRWATVGCRSLQYSSVKDHERSREHILSMPIWEARDRRRGRAPMDRHVDNMINRECARIITCMKILYFTIQKDRSILSYEDTCQLMRDLHTPEMPVNDDYGAYTSNYAALEFLWAISEHIRDKLLIQSRGCPGFSLMVDESTDRTLEQHLIIYVCYLTGQGSGVPVTQFVELSSITSGTGEGIYTAVDEVLNKLHWNRDELVAVATDGASAMIGSRSGFTTRLRNDQPSLVNVHCIAHRYNRTIVYLHIVL